MDAQSYIILHRVWDQVGALSEVEEEYAGVQIYCSLGTINIIINNASLTLNEGESLDEGVVRGKTFSITGTGTWKGFLRGAK